MVLKQHLLYKRDWSMFENDVKMYGTQAKFYSMGNPTKFENDVKMYGTQAPYLTHVQHTGLRMM